MCVAVFARSAAAHAPPPSPPTIPDHLVVDNQYFDASPDGLRLYLESLRPTNPDLYAQLSPEVGRLETRQTTARTLMIAGFALGLASTAYAIFGRDSCNDPVATDPNFAADVAAWSACNDANETHLATFILVGAGAILAGMAGYAVTTPTRDDLLEVVNRHNRSNPHPLQLQLGFDPVTHLAHAGAALTF